MHMDMRSDGGKEKQAPAIKEVGRGERALALVSCFFISFPSVEFLQHKRLSIAGLKCSVRPERHLGVEEMAPPPSGLRRFPHLR